MVRLGGCQSAFCFSALELSAIGSWLVYGEGTTIPVENQNNGAATDSLANLGTSINGNVMEYTSAPVLHLLLNPCSRQRPLTPLPTPKSLATNNLNGL